MAVQTRAAEFRDTLRNRVLVTDGAMGTALLARSTPGNRNPDEMNLSLPALVRDVHREYLAAGAEIIETNTFGANRVRLAKAGLAPRVKQINRAAVRIAREAAGESAFVAGAIGPLGARLAPLGPLSAEDARSAFREQIAALLEAGIDLLILETFWDVGEAREAIAAAREATGDEIVLVVNFTVQDDGRLHDGTSMEELATALEQEPVDVIGVNCSSGPTAVLEAIERLSASSSKPLSAMPGASNPYSPLYLAQYADRFVQAGVRILGGCCGTTPEHIRAVRDAITHRAAEAPPRTATVRERTTSGLRPVPAAERSQLGRRLATREFVTMLEIVPPRGADLSKEIEGARLAKTAGIDIINVPDGPRGSARLSAVATCQVLERETGVETVLHVSCRDRNVIDLQSELLGAHVSGIRNLLCITGDPRPRGAYPDATTIFDVDSVGLANIARRLNEGVDLGGNALGSQTALLIGVAANPGSANLDEELRHLDAKIAAGADFIMTQPIFDLVLFENFVRRIEHYKIPVIAGIWPLASYRNAEFVANELHVPIPETLLNRIQSASETQDEGLAIAREVLDRIKPMVAGVQLHAPHGNYAAALEIAATSSATS